MTEAAHTPGPWTVEPLQWDHGASIAIVARGYIVATIPPENEADDPDIGTAQRGPHDQANARLIAAAPDGYQLAHDLEAQFGALIDANESISGAEAVDVICQLAPLWRAVLKKAVG